MPPQNVNNFVVSAGAHITFTAATTVAGPRKFRIAKKREEAKKVKKLAFKTPEGLRTEAARLRAAADKEEEETKRKRAKANTLCQEADEIERNMDERIDGEKGMMAENGVDGMQGVVEGGKQGMVVRLVKSE